MNEAQEKVYRETRIRNLKRKLSRLSTHPDLTNEYLRVKKEIEALEK